MLKLFDFSDCFDMICNQLTDILLLLSILLDLQIYYQFYLQMLRGRIFRTREEVISGGKH